jgi:CRISPR type III-A-associated RAMP protein Csm4
MTPDVPNLRFVARFRPTGPWRIGPDSGARDRVDTIYHSDAAFSAVCGAMARLGAIEEWLDATARRDGAPAVRFSSFYPFQGKHMFVVPPRSVWPPPDSPKVRYKGARFVPLALVESLLAGKPIDEDNWFVDGESECLVHSGGPARQGPFRIVLRSNAGVDRLVPGLVAPHATACLEFARDAGLWTIVQFSDEEAREKWEQPVRGAFRLLADSGFGGERSRGWGRSQMPEWDPGPAWTGAGDAPERAYWLLSLYTPAASDSIDWKRGSYSTIQRRGRIESAAAWGEPKSATRMIAEGSVLLSASEPRGSASDVAPESFSHPVFRAGFAVALAIPWGPAA